VRAHGFGHGPRHNTLVAWIYIGGGRHADLRVPNLNEALCRAWVAELVQTGSNLARCGSAADLHRLRPAARS